MQVRISVLADYASVSEGHKLNILGIFRQIIALSEPVVCPQIKVVAQFEFNSSETGSRTLKIVLVDADGREIFMVSGQIQVPHSSDGKPTLLNQILNLNNIVLPKFGQYEFRILLDDITQCTIPLDVVRAQLTPETR